MSDMAVRNQYRAHGVSHYYEQFGADYRNPHEPIIRKAVRQALNTWELDSSHVLDLACGSGEVTLALRELGVRQITGVDPYTGVAYQQRTELTVLQHSFEQIGAGALAGHSFSLTVCSFALHLVAVSWLPSVVFQLSQLAPHLLILTPHKRPDLRPEWGMQFVGEFVTERVRTRLYKRTIGND